MLYLALVKTSRPLHPSKLVLRDDAEKMKKYLLSISSGVALESLAEYNLKSKTVKFYSVKDLVKFLED